MTTAATGPYNGNGNTVVFSFTFMVHDEADLTVSLTTTRGVALIQRLGVDYTVSGVGSPTGGQVTMVVPPPSGTQLLIFLGRVIPAPDNTPLISNVFREFRPGDAPNYFDLTGGELTSGLNGGVYRFTGSCRASMKYSVPLEPG